jgi:hypothetical protein
MSPSEKPDADELTPEERSRRRRRLAEVFGEVLPSQTADDVDLPDGEQDQARSNDEWLRRQVPPHHG